MTVWMNNSKMQIQIFTTLLQNMEILLIYCKNLVESAALVEVYSLRVLLVTKCDH